MSDPNPPPQRVTVTRIDITVDNWIGLMLRLAFAQVLIAGIVGVMVLAFYVVAIVVAG